MLSFDARGKLCLKLQAQSPMIHFQAREPGATLRASEVKPKLDRYLLWRLQQETGQDVAALAKHPEYRDWFRPSTDENTPPNALRYQMQIFCEEAPTVVVLNLERSVQTQYPEGKRLSKYPIYYANSGVKDPKQQRLGIVSDPTVVIHCFCAPLQTWIADNLEDFFLVTNFGTMQNKGFGGFAPEGMTFDKAKLRRAAERLKAQNTANHCLLLSATRQTARKHMDFSGPIQTVERFYHLMKSGYNFRGTREYERSFLFQYMHQSPFEIGNEKEWMKHQGISPVVGRRPNLSPEEEKQPNYYVRALLGTAGNVTYQEEGGGRMSISISSKEMERVPSPIFFKVLGNNILAVASQVDTRVYDKQFTFKGYRSDTLPTPSKDINFDADAFLFAFAGHYMDLLRRNKLPVYLEGAQGVKLL